MTQLPAERQWLRALTVDTIIWDPEEVMADINAALTASKEALSS